MGVYVFQSRHGSWIKVGHYARTNAWSRVAHRGFSSCARPPGLLRVGIEDVDLVAWYPSYTRVEEVGVKKTFKAHRARSARGGPTEWYAQDAREAICAFLAAQGGAECAAGCDKAAALATTRRL